MDAAISVCYYWLSNRGDIKMDETITEADWLRAYENRKLVYMVLSRFLRLPKHSPHYDDCYEVGIMALARACRDHDPEKGELSTIAVPRIRVQVNRELKRCKETISTPTHRGAHQESAEAAQNVLSFDYSDADGSDGYGWLGGVCDPESATQSPIAACLDSMVTHGARPQIRSVVVMLAEGYKAVEIAQRIGTSHTNVGYWIAGIKVCLTLMLDLPRDEDYDESLDLALRLKWVKLIYREMCCTE